MGFASLEKWMEVKSVHLWPAHMKRQPMFKIEALIWVSIWRALKFQSFNKRGDSNPRCRSKNIEMKYKIHIKLVHEIYGTTCFLPVQCEELCLLILVAGRLYWGLQVTSSFSIWGCILKGCFERDIFWRAKSRLKGIEGFNLEHWQQPLSR